MYLFNLQSGSGGEWWKGERRKGFWGGGRVTREVPVCGLCAGIKRNFAMQCRSFCWDLGKGKCAREEQLAGRGRDHQWGSKANFGGSVTLSVHPCGYKPVQTWVLITYHSVVEAKRYIKEVRGSKAHVPKVTLTNVPYVNSNNTNLEAIPTTLPMPPLSLPSYFFHVSSCIKENIYQENVC